MFGLPEATGSHIDSPVDGCLARAMFELEGVKGFEIGEGFDGCHKKGSKVKDRIVVS